MPAFRATKDLAKSLMRLASCGLATPALGDGLNPEEEDDNDFLFDQSDD